MLHVSRISMCTKLHIAGASPSSHRFAAAATSPSNA
jgi:hypothetical protein